MTTNRTHCKNGHAYTPENTLVRKNGQGRSCKICQRLYRKKSETRESLTEEQRIDYRKRKNKRYMERLRKDPVRWARYRANQSANEADRYKRDPEKMRMKMRRKSRMRYSDPVRGPILRARRNARIKELRKANPEKYRVIARRKYHSRKSKTATPVDHSKRLYMATLQAVPRSYPPDVRDDIASAIIVSVLDGTIRERDIAKSVKEYARKHYRQYDQFKNVSLDAAIPGTDNLRLIDTLADDTFHF